MKKHAGFTLIELVAVLVILAILAVVAVPQFLDLRVQAANAEASGVGGAIASGTALNYARGISGTTGAIQVNGCSGTQLGPLIGVTGSTATNIPLNGRNHTIGGVTGGLASGASRTCTILLTGVTGALPQNFTIVGCGTATTC